MKGIFINPIDLAIANMQFLMCGEIIESLNKYLKSIEECIGLIDN